MKNIKYTLILALVFASLQCAIAQKFGHINSQQLLLELPQIKTADQQLTEYQKTLMSKGEQMLKNLESNYNAYVAEANSGTLSQIQMQQKEGELAKEQQAIQAYELEVQNLLVAKREELYKPILDDVKAKVDQIGKDGGYTMIFDSSGGFLLHMDNSEDLMTQVRTVLGL